MKWVQVKENVYLTVTVCDLENVKIEFDATHMNFRSCLSFFSNVVQTRRM